MAIIPMIPIGRATALDRSIILTERRFSGSGGDDFLRGLWTTIRHMQRAIIGFGESGDARGVGSPAHRASLIRPQKGRGVKSRPIRLFAAASARVSSKIIVADAYLSRSHNFSPAQIGG
jgi:hypothetical protein